MKSLTDEAVRQIEWLADRLRTRSKAILAAAEQLEASAAQARSGMLSQATGERLVATMNEIVRLQRDEPDPGVFAQTLIDLVLRSR